MATLETVHIKNDTGDFMRINTADLAEWEASGWKKAKSPKPVAPVPELGISDEEADVEIAATMSKSKIAEALESPKYDAIRDRVDMGQRKADLVAQIADLLSA